MDVSTSQSIPAFGRTVANTQASQEDYHQLYCFPGSNICQLSGRQHSTVSDARLSYKRALEEELQRINDDIPANDPYVAGPSGYVSFYQPIDLFPYANVPNQEQPIPVVYSARAEPSYSSMLPNNQLCPETSNNPKSRLDELVGTLTTFCEDYLKEEFSEEIKITITLKPKVKTEPVEAPPIELCNTFDTAPSTGPRTSPECFEHHPEDPPKHSTLIPVLDHPWSAHLVAIPDHLLDSVTEDQVTSVIDLPLLPSTNYIRRDTVLTLFPTIKEKLASGTKLTAFDLMSPQAAVAMRQSASVILQKMRDHLQSPSGISYEDDASLYPQRDMDPHLEANRPSHSVLPPKHPYGRRPVLFQVIALCNRVHLILEAKDFLLYMPDAPHLRFVYLDNFALNIASAELGVTEDRARIGDLVWIYSIAPPRNCNSRAAFDARLARAMDKQRLFNERASFFRAWEFALVTPYRGGAWRTACAVNARLEPPNRLTAGISTPDSARLSRTTNSAARQLYADGKDLQPKLIRTFVLEQTFCGSRFSAGVIAENAVGQLHASIRTLLPSISSELPIITKCEKLTESERYRVADLLGRNLFFRTEPLADALQAKLTLMNVAYAAQYHVRKGDERWRVLRFRVTRSDAALTTFTAELNDETNPHLSWFNGTLVVASLPGLRTEVLLSVHSLRTTRNTERTELTLQTTPANARMIYQAVKNRQSVEIGFQLLATDKITMDRIPMEISQIAEGSAEESRLRLIYGDFAAPGDTTCKICSAQNTVCDPRVVPCAIALNAPPCIFSPLRDAQRHALALCLNPTDPIVFVDGCPGSGKTSLLLLLAAIAAKQHGYLVVCIAPTFYALKSMAVKYVSINNGVKGSALAHLFEDRHDDQLAVSLDAAREQLTINSPIQGPSVLFATVQTLLDALTRASFTCTPGVTPRVTQRILLLVDDCSALSEPQLLLLNRHLPDTPHRYFGDRQAVGPRSAFDECNVLTQLCALSAAEVLARANAVRKVPLRETFRLKQETLGFLRNVFGTELTGISAQGAETSTSFRSIDFPNPDIPFAFVTFPSSASRDNLEAKFVRRLVSHVLDHEDIPSGQISIVCSCHAHIEALRDLREAAGVQVLSGHQSLNTLAKLVILLAPTETLLQCGKRSIYTALTRTWCAQIVVGRGEQLRQHAPWKALVRTAEANRCLTTAPYSIMRDGTGRCGDTDYTSEKGSRKRSSSSVTRKRRRMDID